MNPEDIDDLFRQQLGGHATPPADGLWARLQASDALNPAAQPTAASAAAETDADRLDQLFRTGLHNHATPPPRELWERLEDEHLRPRKRRAAAWWPMAVAAVVALLIVAGGAGLLRSGYFSSVNDAGIAARQPSRVTNGAQGKRTNSNAASGPIKVPATTGNSVAHLDQTADATAPATGPSSTPSTAETTKKEALVAASGQISENSKKLLLLRQPAQTRPHLPPQKQAARRSPPPPAAAPILRTGSNRPPQLRQRMGLSWPAKPLPSRTRLRVARLPLWPPPLPPLPPRTWPARPA